MTCPDPAGHLVDETPKTGILTEPEERRLRTQPPGRVELLDGLGDRERVRRIVEPGVSVSHEMRGRLPVGDDEQDRLVP